jgi:hypothetical protein
LSNTKTSQFSTIPVARFAPVAKSIAKSQTLLRLTIEQLLRSRGLNHVLFITLTFADDVRSTHEAQRRLNSFLNKIRDRHTGYIWVLQPHASGAIHFHMLLPVDFDAHKGTDVWMWRRTQHASDTAKYSSMNPALREESDWFAVNARLFGFGRSEVAPIYSEKPEAIGNYLARQDWRTGQWPFVETKSFRFWGCSRHLRAGTMAFSWVSERARVFRAKLREWCLSALHVAADDQHRIRELEENAFRELHRRFGPRWFLRFRSWLRLNGFEDSGGQIL